MKISLLHATRAMLLTALVVAVGVAQVDPAKLNRLATPSSANNVLAFATSMSRADLLTAANQSRAAHGLPPLKLDGKLNSSAQMKAQHMVDGDYWSHVAPDGTQPWYFFEMAGYSYLAAGENLAYGFATSLEANNGWMNSPSHRANILGSYKEVGFGFVNGPSFQGKENTVVVAHYATPSVSAPAPAPTPSQTPKPEPAKPQTLPVTTETSTQQHRERSADQPPVEDQKPTKADKEDTETKHEDEAPKESTEELVVNLSSDGSPPINIGATTSISVWQSLLNGNLPQRFVISLGIILVALFGYTLAHRSLIKQAHANGQQLALRHPALDAIVLTSAILIILTTSVAWLQ